jgi:hypothetical protein
MGGRHLSVVTADPNKRQVYTSCVSSSLSPSHTSHSRVVSGQEDDILDRVLRVTRLSDDITEDMLRQAFAEASNTYVYNVHLV